MDTIELTSFPAGASTVANPARRHAGPLPEPARDEAVGAADFDGLRWKYRNGFGDVLAHISAAEWSRPEKQGWQRIKHNSAREVWQASVAGHNYYLKYYERARWIDSLKTFFRGDACEAEWNGGMYALATGIAAVRPAGYTLRLTGPRRHWSLLVTEAIEPAYPLNDFWQMLQRDEDSPRQRADVAQLIDQLAALIARAHQAGFEHLDMHAANILVQPLAPRRYRALFVDLHSARMGVPLGERAVVRNLAQLNQWFRRHSTIGDRLRFLRSYLRWRNEFEHAFPHGCPLGVSFDGLVRALVVAAHSHAERLWARRDRRIVRKGRYFTTLKVGGWRGMAYVCAKHADDESQASTLILPAEWWRKQLADPGRLLDEPTGEVCKNSHSGQVRRAALHCKDATVSVIIKRPLARNWLRRVRQLVGPSRSLRTWRNGYALLNRDIPTARPLAVLERRVGPLVLDSLVLMELAPDSLDLLAHLRRESAARGPHDWFSHKRRVSRLLATELRRLQERGFAHRDCKAENILISGHAEPRLLWIDMDGLRRTPRLTHAERLRPLMRLHVSLLAIPSLTRTDRVRFLKDYFARFGADPLAWRAAWRELAGAVETKLRQREKRRQWKLAHYGRA